MSQNSEVNKQEGFLIKLAKFIVDKRSLIFLLIIIQIILSFITSSWVSVEDDLITYLPDDAETKVGIDLMSEEFVTYGSAEIMVANITLDEAESLADELREIKGVQTVTFDETTDHYNDVSALYSISFDYDEDDPLAKESLDRVNEYLKDYDTFVSSDLNNTTQVTIEKEISLVIIYVAIIVVVVLILTSQTYAEVPVLLITFLVAMQLNTGTNFILGTISFVSNSVTSILQLALSLDYAIIFCNRFKEEHEHLPIREAAIVALSKAIPEIGASCLTTIGGLVAMMFMQFKIGPDMAICLIKAIAFALFSVFIVMPGLLVLFGPLMDKTKHKNFVPKIPFVGKFDYATRKVVPFVFIGVVVAAFVISSRCNYAYGYAGMTTPKLNDDQIASQMIEKTFTSNNMVALVVPAGDYEKEGELLKQIETHDEIVSTTGLSNVEAMDGYTLTDRLTPRQFAELADLDYELAELVYTGYATEHDEYGKLIGGVASYSVPLMDMFLYVCEQVDSGIVTLDEEQTETLASAKVQMSAAKAQLQGENYSRMLIYIDDSLIGDEAYAFIDELRDEAKSFYGEDVKIVGNLTNEYDFKKSFEKDNKVVSLISIIIVLIVLLFTFESAGMPVLLIMVIQGSIWLNFSVPVFTGGRVFFMAYLVVSSIQMGANIDYAIVIAGRFNELKDKMDKREAIIETMNFAFPTIITSGLILAVAGILLGHVTSEVTICGIGDAIGRGTILSILLVMFVLPQILLLGEKIIDKTSFKVPKVAASQRLNANGNRVAVDGLVTGEINGTFSGIMRGTVDGTVDLRLISGNKENNEKEADDNE